MTYAWYITISFPHINYYYHYLFFSGTVLGVESAALTGQEKDHLEVVGDGVDSVELTRRLRKHVAHSELVSVSDATKPKPPALPPVVGCPQPPPYGIPQYKCYCEVVDPFYDRAGPCTLMWRIQLSTLLYIFWLFWREQISEN